MKHQINEGPMESKRILLESKQNLFDFSPEIFD